MATRDDDQGHDELDLETLQEQALQRELPIFAEDGETLLDSEELTAAIAAYDEAHEEDDAPPAPPPPAKKSAAKKAATEKAATPPKEAAKPAPAAKPQASKAKAATGAKRAAVPPDEKLKGLPPITDADHALAAQHNWPVAVPGAKAYRTNVAFHDPFVNREIFPGETVLLTDQHAENKREFLTPL